MMRRILSIWLPSLAIDRWRRTAPRGADTQPVGLAADTAHGPRLVAVNAVAAAAGVAPGMRLADARPLCPALVSWPHDPTADRALLERLALWTQRWGPLAAIDQPDALLVDIGGAAHLFGGEAAVVALATAELAAHGYAARAGIAATAGAAWAMSHHGRAPAIIPADAVPHDHLAILPVAALRLDAETDTLLARLGLKRIGDLAALPREALARRFRNRRAAERNPLIRLDQLLGRLPEPLLPVIATPMPLVQRRLVEPIRHRALLDRVVVNLAADMAALLEARGLGARRLLLRAWRVDGMTLERRVELAAASREADHILRLFARRLDDIDAGFGIDQVQLLAPWTEPLELVQADMAATIATGTSLSQCLDRLMARLGPDAVARPVPQPSHSPERSQRWLPPLALSAGGQGELGLHRRPLKLLDRAEAISVVYATPEGLPRSFRWRGVVHSIVRAGGPERISPEWWRERSTARLRDYYRVEDSEGRRYWIYRHEQFGDRPGAAPDWYLHGLFG